MPRACDLFVFHCVLYLSGVVVALLFCGGVIILCCVDVRMCGCYDWLISFGCAVLRGGTVPLLRC